MAAVIDKIINIIVRGDDAEKKIANVKLKLKEFGESAIRIGDDVGKVGAGIAGAFSVIDGAIGAFGDSLGYSSEAIAEAQQKATSFLAIASGIKPMIEGAVSAFKIFNLVLLANPIVLIITAAVAAITVLIVYWEEITTAVSDFFNSMSDGVKIATSILFPFIGVLILLNEVLGDSKEANEELTEAEKKANAEREKETKRIQAVLIEAKKRNDALTEEAYKLKRVESAIKDKYAQEIASAQLAGKTGEAINAIKRKENEELEKNLILQAQVLQARINNAIQAVADAKRISTEQARQLILQDAALSRFLEQAERTVQQYAQQVQEINETQATFYKEQQDKLREQKELEKEVEQIALDSLNEVVEIRIEELERMFKEEQEAKEKTAAMQKKINQQMIDDEMQRLEKENEAREVAASWIETIINSETASYKKKFDAIESLRQQDILNEEEYNKALGELEESRSELRNAIVDEVKNTAQSMNDFFSQLNENSLNKINQQEQAALAIKGLTEQQKYNIETKFANERNKIARREFLRNKAFQTGNAIVDGIQATQKALASAPPPANFILAGLVGTAAALNVAKILATKFEGEALPAPPDLNPSTGSNSSSAQGATPSFNLFGTAGAFNNLSRDKDEQDNTAMSVKANVSITEIKEVDRRTASYQTAVEI